MERKRNLAEALLAEKNRIPEISAFGDKTNFKDYDLAIEYLTTGKHPAKYEDYDLLSACIDDFETVCSDYGI